LIALTSDASGESRRARLDTGLLFPELAVFDCFAHQVSFTAYMHPVSHYASQVNLVVGELFKKQGPLYLEAISINETISFIRGKTGFSGLIRAQCVTDGRRALSLLRGLETRWSSFYLAFERLERLEDTIKYVIADDQRKPNKDQIIVQGNTRAKVKAEQIVRRLQTPAFWDTTKRYELSQVSDGFSRLF
jgi:hypothetical protein